MLVTAIAHAPPPLLELTFGIVEGAVRLGSGVLEAVLPSGSIVDHKLVFGKAHVDGEPAAIAVVMLVAFQLDNDMARDDAVEDPLEPVDALLEMGDERVGVGDPSKGDLKGRLHGSSLAPNRMHGSCAVGSQR